MSLRLNTSPEQSSRVGLITSGAQQVTLSMQLCVISIYVAQYTTGELWPQTPAEHSKPVPVAATRGRYGHSLQANGDTSAD